MQVGLEARWGEDEDMLVSLLLSSFEIYEAKSYKEVMK